LSPFIVTLGMWGALRGAAKGLGDNQPIYPELTWLNELMQLAERGPFAMLAPGVWLMLLLAGLMAFALHYTRFGRHVYAIGSNELTARLCGIHVPRTQILIYAIAAACTGLAAVLQFAFLYGQGDPTTAEGYELKVIASGVIGGASLSGGEGTILGTLVGALIMTVVDNGCTKLGLDNWVQEIVTGGIILTAVTLDRLRQRRGR
jgi:ribose/xylose/arabinose/galactoside ABC-type transport system permease subunit